MEPDFPEALVAQVRRGLLLVIAGAGVSQAASGGRQEANWIGLLRKGLDHLEAMCGRPDRLDDTKWVGDARSALRNAPDALTLTFLADQLRERMNKVGGDEAFDKWLVDTVTQLDDHIRRERARNPSALVQAMLALNAPLATTNYDQTLEIYSESAPITMRTHGDVSALLTGQEGGVLHIHGLPSVPGSVVLGREDYKKHVGNRAAMALQATLGTIRSCLFVGFGAGLEDPNLKPWLEWISTTFAGGGIEHFVLMRDSEASAWGSVRYMNVHVLRYGSNYEDLPGYLAKLRSLADAPVSAALATQPAPAGEERLLLRQRIIRRCQGCDRIARILHAYVEDALSASRSLIYYTKYRVKAEHAFHRKVRELTEADSTGGALVFVDAVTDVIGIRIVTLYGADVRHVACDLMDHLLPGARRGAVSFNATLDRVKIFVPETTGGPDDDMDSIKRHADAYGITRRTVTAPSYVGCHLKGFCLGDDGQELRFEIQIRSAFEDVWNELDYGLRDGWGGSRHPHSARTSKELRLLDDHLVALRANMRGASLYAEAIRRQVDHLKPPEVSRMRPYTRDNTARLQQLLTPSQASTSFRREFGDLFQKQKKLIGVSSDNDIVRSDQQAPSKDLDVLADEFLALQAQAGALQLVPGGEHEEIRVMLRMEAALCRLEAAVRQPRPHRDEALKPVLKDYVAILAVLGRHAEAPWIRRYKVMALYRYARLRSHQKKFDDALSLCEQAYSLVACESPAGDVDEFEHSMLIEISKYYLWLLQEHAEEAVGIAVTEENPGYRLDERRRDYVRMTQVAFEGYTKFDDHNEELLDAALYGAAEHAALGTDVWSDGSVTEQQIGELRRRFNVERRIASGKPHLMHTAFRVAEHVFHDLDATRRAAEAFEQCVSSLSEPDEYQKRALRQVQNWLRNDR